MAAKDIKEGETIMEEQPAVRCPPYSTKPVCLGCYTFVQKGWNFSMKLVVTNLNYFSTSNPSGVTKPYFSKSETSGITSSYKA